MIRRDTVLRREVAEQAFERFGFARIPEPTLDNLHAIYRAWSRNVGYDNVQKRVYFARGGVGPFPPPVPVPAHDTGVGTTPATPGHVRRGR